MLKIYNTLTRKKEEFSPCKDKTVKMYTCGVTVYDDCHIGHARSLYIFEVIRRYLKYSKFNLEFVRNITDIDDKIINRAKELNLDWQQLVDKYIEHYHKDLAALNLGVADREPRATENISEMIEYIKGLIEKGYAYVTDSGVYFEVRKFKDYGKLSHQNIDAMMNNVRIEADETKRDPLDFALWKKSKEGEPWWMSPWGGGRPGWHIECSVMSQKYLETDTLDIHGGGRDLIFPHHENEIAQAEALKDKLFSRFWIHHGLLTINGQKMAKSLGNFVTIGEVLNKYPADVLKIFYLQAHYSSSIDFFWQKMEESKSAYERILILRDALQKEYGNIKVSEAIKSGTGAILQYKQKFAEAMDDDFNTPKGLAILFDMVNECNKLLEGKEELKPFIPRDKEAGTGLRSAKSDIQEAAGLRPRSFILRYAMEIMREMADVFCLDALKEEPTKVLDAAIQKKINLRLKYRKEKKFQEADEIRKELEAQGIILEDTKEGMRWRKKL